MARNTTCRARCIVSSARPASGARTRPSTSTRWCRRRSWRPSTTGWCRWSRNSSCRRMGMRSRTAKAGRLAGAPRPAEAHLSGRRPVPPPAGLRSGSGGHFLFVCKPSSHQTIEEYLTGIELPTLTPKVKRGRERFDYRYRWLSDVPLRGDALIVNWLMIEIVNAAGTVTYRNSFITDLEVGPDTVAELAACGRARWKIENESFNVLKNNGYNLEHNFGHGEVNLSAVFVSLNLLAFAFHTVCDLAEDLWRKAMEKMGTRGGFFENLRSITTFLIFPTWDDLLATLAFARPPPTKHHEIPSRCPI